MPESTKTFFNMSKRFDVLLRDDFTCRYCGLKAPHTELEVDHVIPVTLGGKATMENGVTACRECNRGKRNKNIREMERVALSQSNVMIRSLFEDRVREYVEESQQKHRYRRQLWRELVREYDLDFDDEPLREGIAEAAMDWAIMGVPMELPVAVFAETVYWYGHQRIKARKKATKIPLANKYVEMVGERIRSCMDGVVVSPSAIADQVEKVQDGLPDNVRSISKKQPA